MSRVTHRTLLALTLCALGPAAANAIQVQSVSPPAHSMGALPGASISVTFDVPVQPATVTPASFRVFGRSSGASAGTFSFSNGGRTVTFTRARGLAAGELVWVNLSHALQGTDLSPMRAAGYAWSFGVRTVPSARAFTQIDVMSNRIAGAQTRIYGAASTDLNEDGWLDLTTVNEVSADIRVFLNRADGTGLYHPILTPEPIGDEGSPNETADLDNDGHADLIVDAVDDNATYVLLGRGDGTFRSITALPVGLQPHGCTVLDADGDDDGDIVNTNNGSNNLTLHLNRGDGTFDPPVAFEGGVHGEYGLAAGDMNGDGITDLVVAGMDGREITTMLGNGNGTFTAAGPPQPSGGRTWVVMLGDVNGDGALDATTANSFEGNAAMLFGLGNGRFAAPQFVTIGAHTVSTDLGDLDGDGDLDWIVSSFGGGFWRLYENDGAGGFTFDQEITAPSNPSCAVPLDIDNDGDLDLALSDEIADVIVLMRNGGAPSGVDGSPADAGRVLFAAPNPFRDAMLVRFRLARAGAATLDVFDVRGRRVATRHWAHLPAGWNAQRLEAADFTAEPVSGVYFAALQADGRTHTSRMARVR